MSKISEFIERVGKLNLEDRKVQALERIADALDRLAPPPLKFTVAASPKSELIETTDEDICRMEDQERELEQERSSREAEANAGKKATPAS
jgi:hypothetical protein